MQQQLNHWLAVFKQQASVQGHRATLIIAGEQAWVRQQATQLVSILGPVDHGYWITADNLQHHGITVLPPKRVRELLGSESDLLIYDAFTGFNPDHFAAITGTLKRGGLLLLLTPPLSQWAEFNDPEYRQMTVLPYTADSVQGYFLRWLVRFINEPWPLWGKWQQGQPLPELPLRTSNKAINTPISHTTNCTADSHTVPRHTTANHTTSSNALTCNATTRLGACVTDDQAEAVAAILKVATGHSKRPLVMTADRGRGKSAALGIAAAQLLQQGKRILVTAPSFEAVYTVFYHAAMYLNVCWQQQFTLMHEQGMLTGVLHYQAPDELCRDYTSADVLLVDEAAAIPTDLLKRWTQHYKRIVFATTVHGYEGTGRGFMVRFQPFLTQLRPQWRALHLSQPIRWKSDDPLEAFCFKALLLNAEPVADEVLSVFNHTELVFKTLSSEQLVQQPHLLRSLFGLLVTAHYRTTPGDLRHLLDGPNLQIWLGLYQGHVVAASLVAFEGGLDQDLAHDVFLGKRRPRGHLLPQTLAAHAGYQQAAGLCCARIIRIAVHPAIQGQGIGKQLINHIYHEVKSEQDYLGVAYGVTQQLFGFWQSLGFLPVRLGLTRESSSGCFALIMAKPIVNITEKLFSQAAYRFHDQFVQLLAELWPDLDYTLVTTLLVSNRGHGVCLSEQDQQDLHAFGFGNRAYETCIPPLRQWLLQFIQQDFIHWQALPQVEQSLLINKVLQQHSWTSLTEATHLGKKQLIKQMRQIVLTWLTTSNSAESYIQQKGSF